MWVYIMQVYTMELRARKGQDAVSHLYSSWGLCDVKKLTSFFEFSYLSALNKAIILLITMIMHNKVGFIIILENYDVYNCELSYVWS